MAKATHEAHGLLDEIPEDPSITMADLQAQLANDPDNLDADFCRVAADLAYWHHQAAHWSAQAMAAYHERKRVEAVEFLRARKGSGDKAVPEKVASAEAESSDAVVAARKEEADCERRKNFSLGIVDAFRAKKDLLQSMGAHLRHQEDVRVREPSGRGK